MSTSPRRSDSAATYALGMLFFAALGWVSAWYLDTEPRRQEAGPARVRVVSREMGRPLPAWVQRVLGSPATRSEAIARADVDFPDLARSAPAVELTYHDSSGNEATGSSTSGDDASGSNATQADFTIRHSNGAAAEQIGRWLAEIIRNEVAIESARREGRALREAQARANDGDPALLEDVETPPDDSVVAEIQDAGRVLDDLYHEKRLLKAEEIRLWGERTQAQGKLAALRASLDTTPPIQVVRKKLIDDAALAGSPGDEGFEIASRVQSLNFEEELPNPVYSHLRGLEEQVMAEGNGYQRRLQELEQEKRNVDDQINLTAGRIRSLEATLDGSQPYVAQPARGRDSAAPPVASVAMPVRVIHPRHETPVLDDPSLLQDRNGRLGLGALLGAFIGWLVVRLGVRPGSRATAAAALLVATVASTPALAQPEIGKEAPELKGSGVKWLNSKAIPIRKLQGKVVFLEFFQTTYEGYDSQITQVREFLSRHTDKEIAYIGVVSGETPKAVEAFAKKMSIEYPIIVDRYAKVQKNYKIGKATLAIIAPDGKVAWTGNPFSLHRVGDYELERVLTAFEKQIARIFLEAAAAFLRAEYASARSLFEKVQARDPRPIAKEGAAGFLARIDDRARELQELADAYGDAGRLADKLTVLERIAREFDGLDAGTEAAREARKLASDPAAKRP